MSRSRFCLDHSQAAPTADPEAGGFEGATGVLLMVGRVRGVTSIVEVTRAGAFVTPMVSTFFVKSMVSGRSMVARKLFDTELADLELPVQECP